MKTNATDVRATSSDKKLALTANHLKQFTVKCARSAKYCVKSS